MVSIFIQYLDNAIFLDVRNPPEYKEGVLPGAITIPLPELE